MFLVQFIADSYGGRLSMTSRSAKSARKWRTVLDKQPYSQNCCATLTDAAGINPAGTIVGLYVDAAGAAHGFIRTP